MPGEQRISKKCLIFFTIGIGDSLMVTPVIEKIKELPGYEFEALTISPQVMDIMKNSGDFREAYIINFLKDGLFESIQALIELRKNRYDMSILVFPSNHYKYHLVHRFIGAKKRFGIKYLDTNFPDLTFLSGKLLKEDRTLHAIEQNFRLFENALGVKLERSVKMRINLIDRDREHADYFIEQNRLTGKTLIGLHPGSDTFKNMERKRWAAENYGELMRTYSDSKDIHFLIFGGRPEKDYNEKVSEMSKNNSTVVKGTHFFLSAAIAEKCAAFICGDTGLMHTASAVGVPVIAIFGPTSSVYTEPLNEGSTVVKKDYPCIPCYEYSRTPLFCDQDDQYKCLKNITVKEIKEILDAKLKDRKSK
jgi:heptosyltransferase II